VIASGIVGACVAILVLLLQPMRGRRRLATVRRLPTAWTWRWAARSRTNRLDEVVFAEVAALLRAGVPPGVAWQRATGVEVDGLGIPDQLQLSERLAPAPAAAMVAAARLAVRVGAPLALVLQSVGEALRVEAQILADQKTALAGPQTTGRVLLALPLLGLLIGWVLGANPLATIADGGVGTVSFVAGLALLAVGRWWIARLVAAAAEH